MIPATYFQYRPSAAGSADWACHSALQTLSFATPKEIAEFYNFVDLAEVTQWLELKQPQGEIRWINVEATDGTQRPRVIFAENWEKLKTPLQFTQRVRILSLFDPALRNRQHTQELFGFSYRIEIFIPASKRVYGYYVFPMLEGDKLIGRIEVKVNKIKNLDLLAFWPEVRTLLTPARKARIQAELFRLCGLADCGTLSGLGVLANAQFVKCQVLTQHFFARLGFGTGS